jgi:hypothetical protein
MRVAETSPYSHSYSRSSSSRTTLQFALRNSARWSVRNPISTPTRPVAGSRLRPSASGPWSATDEDLHLRLHEQSNTRTPALRDDSIPPDLVRVHPRHLSEPAVLRRECATRLRDRPTFELGRGAELRHAQPVAKEDVEHAIRVARDQVVGQGDEGDVTAVGADGLSAAVEIGLASIASHADPGREAILPVVDEDVTPAFRVAARPSLIWLIELRILSCSVLRRSSGMASA